MIEIKDSDMSCLKDKTCLILLYCTATWCGPCQRIKPLIQKLSDGLDQSLVEIYQVDIDENDDLVSELDVDSVPTFKLLKGPSVIGECSGADITNVHNLLKEHMIDIKK